MDHHPTNSETSTETEVWYITLGPIACRQFLTYSKTGDYYSWSFSISEALSFPTKDAAQAREESAGLAKGFSDYKISRYRVSDF